MSEERIVSPRTEKPGLLHTLFYLVFAGLAAAVIIIAFGIASFSFLYIGKELPGGSHISGVFPYAHVDGARAALVPAETKLPNAAAKATPAQLPTAPATDNNMRPPEVSRAQPASEPLPSDEVSATQDDSLGGTSPKLSPAEARFFREFKMYQNRKVPHN